MGRSSRFAAFLLAEKGSPRLLCWLASGDNSTCPQGGLTLLQKLNSLQRLTVEVAAWGIYACGAVENGSILRRHAIEAVAEQ